MKLASSYNRVNLLAGICILLITGLFYYRAISYILTSQLDKELKVEEREIIGSVKAKGKIPASTKFEDQQIIYRRTTLPSPRLFFNMEFDNQREMELGRELITNVQLQGENYQVAIILSRVESDDLIQIIFLITIVTAIVSLLILYLLNRFLLGKLWQPFYSTLAKIKNFQLQSPDFNFPISKIEEFTELNQVVQNMAARINTEFSDLKTFTENAAHELMTPVAVMRSKLDSLIQTDKLSQEQTELVSDIYQSVSKMARINHSLVLLVKIDNKLLQDIALIDLEQVIQDKLKEFQELATTRGLFFTINLSSVKVTMSRYLADILLNNLFTNAINHNHHGADINIELNENYLSFSNPALNDTGLTEKIFERFQKSSSSEGTGLGLTIVRQICTGLGYHLSYCFINKRHVFKINFHTS